MVTAVEKHAEPTTLKSERWSWPSTLTNTSYAWMDLSYGVVDARDGIARMVKCDSSHDIPEPDEDCVSFIELVWAKKQFHDYFDRVSSNFDRSQRY